MVPGRADPTVHEFSPRDRGERLGDGIATAATGPPDGRENPAAGHEPRASGRRASSPPIRVKDRDTTDRWTGPARPWPRPRRRVRRGHGRGPGDEPGAHATGDRAPDDPSPGMQSTTTAGWADPRRAGACAVPPTRLIPGAVAVTPRRSRPGRPGKSGAGTIRPGPSPRPTGNRTRRRHDLADHAEREASTPPRAGPAWTRRQPQARSDPSKNSTTMTAAGSSPAGPSRTWVGSAGRSSRTRMPPPTGARTGRGGCLLRGGCGGVPRPPGLPGEEDRRFFQEPVPHAGLPELCLQTFDLGVLFRGHGISAEVGVFLPPSCDPVPDCLRHKTVRSGHPGYRPGLLDDLENDLFLKFRTVFRCRHDLILPHDHFTHRPKNTKHSSPLNSVPYVSLRLFRGPTRPRTVAAAASSPPARSALTTKSHTTSDAACRSSRLRSPLTEEPPEEPPGVGRQNHTNAATRTTPPSTSRNERNNTLDPTEPLPSGTIQEPHPEPPANRPRTSRVATGRPSLDHLQPGQEPDGSATTGQRMDRRDRMQIRVTLQEASTAPGPAARAVQGRCGRSARPPRHPPTGAPLPRGPRGSPRPRGRRQASRVAGEASAAVRATSAGTTTSAVGRGEDAG